MRRSFLLFVAVIFSASGAFAWGEKGHYIINQAAAYGTPAEMPHFFHRAYTQLVYLAPEPDRWRSTTGESLDAVNPPDHFLDFEYVEHLELPPQRYAYLHLLEESGTLRQRGISNSTAGFLPWRIAEVTELLEVQWRLWRAGEGTTERGQVEQNIIHLAGILGHYVADSANPHHTTVNYNGWVTDNPKGFANDCETHSRFESVFVGRNVEFDHVYRRLGYTAARTGYFSLALQAVRDSNGLVETLYTLDRDGAFTDGDTEAGIEFAAARMAAGASLLRDLWWSAYVNSAPIPR